MESDPRSFFRDALRSQAVSPLWCFKRREGTLVLLKAVRAHVLSAPKRLFGLFWNSRSLLLVVLGLCAFSIVVIEPKDALWIL